MRTILLGGKKAAGRVTRVDDGDYDLVMQYAWRVYERDATATRRAVGPYAMTTVWDSDGKRYRSFQMHRLITGYPKTDHIDHDGLNNQRYNLRPATTSQNSQNQRPRSGFSSQYKGVFRVKKSGMWRAVIGLDCDTRRIGDFVSELEAAYAYDAAARKLFGEYACPNFPEGPTRAMRDEWQAEHDARQAILAEEHARRQAARSAKGWEDRPLETYVCVFCGAKYASRSRRPTFHCGNICYQRDLRQRERERRLEGRLF